MNKFSCNYASYHCEIAKNEFDFRASLLNDIIRSNHEMIKQISLLVMIFFAVKNAEKRKLIEIVHVLAIFFKELHLKAAV